MTELPTGQDGPGHIAAVAAVIENGDGIQLKLATDSGDEQSFPLRSAKPKKPIRFTVGQPGRRSTIWRLWANATKDDVYLACLLSAHIFKFSLHESGDWRLAAIAKDLSAVPFVKLTGAAPKGRVMHQWARPPAEDNGWTDALSIWVLAEHVLNGRGDTEQDKKDVQWISPPPPGSAVEFRLFLVRPSLGLLDLTPALTGPDAHLTVVDGFRLAGGEAVVLLAFHQRLDQTARESLDQYVQDYHARVPEDFDLNPARGPRALMINVDDDGHRSFWDLSLLRTPASDDAGPDVVTPPAAAPTE